MIYIICNTVASKSIFLDQGSLKFILKNLPIAEENYVKKVIIKLKLMKRP